MRLCFLIWSYICCPFWAVEIIQEVQNLFQISVYMFTTNNITFGYMVYLWFFILIKLIFYYYFYF